MSDRSAALTFGGGLGLAAYHGGVYQAFSARGGRTHWVTGSSAGAVTAALIAGGAEEERLARLRAFWRLPEQLWLNAAGPWLRLRGWLSAIETHLVGRAGQFIPRWPGANALRFKSLYDLGPMRERIQGLVDFGRLNAGPLRITIAATDVETGEPKLFDSTEQPITIDHILASCGFLPEFAPVEIDGRAFVDGGFSFNAPFDPVIEQTEGPLTLFIADLFPADGARPQSLEAAAERKTDLMFANQTIQRLRDKLAIRRLSGRAHDEDRVVLVSYRAGPEEPGSEKSFNLANDAIAMRWEAGRLDMQAALEGEWPAPDGFARVRRVQARQ